MSAIAGGLVTALAVAAILIYSLTRSSGAGEKALTNTAAFNPSPTQIAAGGAVPAFTLKDVDGKAYSLAAQRGHPVVLEFFAVWCPVCHAEAPIMAKIEKQYARRVSASGRSWRIPTAKSMRPAEAVICDRPRRAISRGIARPSTPTIRSSSIRHLQP
jgi:thiol-disulfide isomerase/thioredoxin